MQYLIYRYFSAKNVSKLLTFYFSKNISIHATVNDQSVNDTLANVIVSFEQLGPGDFGRLKPESSVLFSCRTWFI